MSGWYDRRETVVPVFSRGEGFCPPKVYPLSPGYKPDGRNVLTAAETAPLAGRSEADMVRWWWDHTLPPCPPTPKACASRRARFRCCKCEKEYKSWGGIEKHLTDVYLLTGSARDAACFQSFLDRPESAPPPGQC